LENIAALGRTAWFRQPDPAVTGLNESRRRILAIIKEQSTASISELARALRVTHEAARKQVLELQRGGLVTTNCAVEDDAAPAAGRPSTQYCLTRAGENIFPKNYAALTVELVDHFGQEALTEIADGTLRRMRERATGPSLAERLAAAREIYADGDEYTSVEPRGDNYVVIEKNCPFLDVAIERPTICSTSVSALRRLTGREVIRERRFQDGDGRCEFHVSGSRRAPRNVRFEIEPPRSDRTP
jgi:predicted ArsR family transcriptional regulator